MLLMSTQFPKPFLCGNSLITFIDAPLLLVCEFVQTTIDGAYDVGQAHRELQKLISIDVIAHTFLKAGKACKEVTSRGVQLWHRTLRWIRWRVCSGRDERR